jgi:hypothetical protein
VLQCSVWTLLEGLELVQLLQCLLILSPRGFSVGIVCPEGLCCCSGKLTFLRTEGQDVRKYSPSASLWLKSLMSREFVCMGGVP